jgi:hypothetical protein
VVVGGVFQRLDFQGEGGSGLYGLRARLPLGRFLVVEPGARYTSFEREPFDDEVDADLDLQLLVVDFQIQVQVPVRVGDSRWLRPWVGVGAGGAVDFRGERGPDDFLVSTFSAAAGVSLDLRGPLTLNVESRFRTLDELEHTAVGWTAGLGLRL